MKKPADEITTPVEQDPGSPASDNVNNGHGINSKSRNARAQARHRAKRKAYIEQLEESVTQLQAALNARDSEGTAPGPSSARLIELEQENSQLRHEINRLRGQLAEALRSSPSQTTPVMSSLGDEYAPRDSKRRKRSVDESFSGSPVTPVSADGTKGGANVHSVPPHLSHARDSQRGGASECLPTVLPPPSQMTSISPTNSTESYFRHANHVAPANALSYTSYQAQKAMDPSYQVGPNMTPSFQNLHPEMFELRDAPGNNWHQMYIQHQPSREVPGQHQLHYSTHQPHHAKGTTKGTT